MFTSYGTADLDAQSINGDHLPLPLLPTPILVATTGIRARSALTAEPRNPIDRFFGYTLSQASTSESRHDQRISAEVLPPYFEAPPAYEKKGSSEPATLAMYLFRFGFLFPPFWIMGACILLSPLRAPESSSELLPWLPEKTDAERQEIIQKMRKTELKWAKRCLIALAVLILIGVVTGLCIWGALRS